MILSVFLFFSQFYICSFLHLHFVIGFGCWLLVFFSFCSSSFAVSSLFASPFCCYQFTCTDICAYAKLDNFVAGAIQLVFSFDDAAFISITFAFAVFFLLLPSAKFSLLISTSVASRCLFPLFGHKHIYIEE